MIKQSSPMTLEEWLHLVESNKMDDEKSRSIAIDNICGYKIQTLFVGIDNIPAFDKNSFQTLVLYPFCNTISTTSPTLELAMKSHDSAILWAEGINKISIGLFVESTTRNL